MADDYLTLKAGVLISIKPLQKHKIRYKISLTAYNNFTYLYVKKPILK